MKNARSIIQTLFLAIVLVAIFGSRPVESAPATQTVTIPYQGSGFVKTTTGVGATQAQVAIGSEVSGLASGVATFLGTPTSANLASAVTNETGSGALVFGTAPTVSGATITTSSLDATNSVSGSAISSGTVATTYGGLGGNFGSSTGVPRFSSGTVSLESPLSIAAGGSGAASISSGIVRSSGTALSGAGTVSLTTEVTGTLPIGSGGTGATSLASGIIKSNGSVLSSGTVDLTSNVTGVLPLANMTAAVTRGAIGSRPSAATAGRLYVATDAPVLSYDTGSAWVTIGTQAFTAPPSQSTFTAYNHGGNSTTWSDSNGGILGKVTNGANAADLRFLAVAISGGAQAHTLTVHFRPTLQFANYAAAIVGWRASSSGNVHVGMLFYNSGLTDNMGFAFRRLSASGTGTSATYTTGADDLSPAAYPALCGGAAGYWWQFKDDGTTNRTFSYSCDGQNYVTLATVTRTTHITPDQVLIGLAGNCASGGSATTATVLFDSYSLTLP